MAATPGSASTLPPLTPDDVVVGLDGSAASTSALRWAVEEAAVRGGTVRAIHAWSVPVMASPVGVIPVSVHHDEIAAGARSGVEGWVHTAREGLPHPDVTVDAVVVEGSPATVLLDAAGAGAGLLVVGGKRHGVLTGMLLGSISQQVTHHAVGPVVVVPAEPERLPGTDGRVVVGIDGSDGALRALDWAVAEAGRRGAPLQVVHGWEVPFAVPPEGIALAPLSDDAFEQDSQDLIGQALEAALERAAVRPPSVEARPVRAPGASALLEVGEGASLVVVGSRGRGGFRGLLLGSVSQQVLHRAPGPVAVIPDRPAG